MTDITYDFSGVGRVIARGRSVRLLSNCDFTSYAGRMASMWPYIIYARDDMGRAFTNYCAPRERRRSEDVGAVYSYCLVLGISCTIH